MTRIVIADDDADIRALVGIAAARAGLEVADSCSDGNAAWEAVRRSRPDLVLLDVAMPGHSGIELARLIRAEDASPRAHIMLLSAAVSERDRAVGLEAGADEYLVKPFSPRELRSRLEAAARAVTAPV